MVIFRWKYAIVWVSSLCEAIIINSFILTFNSLRVPIKVPITGQRLWKGMEIQK